MGSFSNSLDLCKKLRGDSKRRKRSNTADDLDAEELRLRKSLRKGHEDIGREYGQNMLSVGNGFAIGDAVAHTSLAEILLKLNTGLVNIIASFLQQDKKHQHKNRILLDLRALADLSERAREDTCQALQQLQKRMCQPLAEPRRLALENGEPHMNRGRPDGKKRRRKPVPKHTKIRGPTLARVTIQNSSQPSQIALVKPGERRKKSSSTASSALSKAHSASSTALPTPTSSLPAYDFVDKAARPATYRSQTMPGVRQCPSHKQLAMNVGGPRIPLKPDTLRATRSTPRLTTAPQHSHEQLPPMPHTAPLPAVTPRMRKPTPTFYSIASDSTKIGEIPLHKWTVPFDFDAMSMMNREAEQNGWPVDQLGNDSKKKRSGLFGLFKRKGASP